MSGTTSRNLEEGNNVRTYSELEVLTKGTKWTNIVIAVWALGWAVFSFILSQKVKGDSPRTEKVLLAAFALYLVEIVVRLFSLYVGWGAKHRTASTAIFLLVCRGLLFGSMAHLNSHQCRKVFYSIQSKPGWCGFVKTGFVAIAGLSVFIDIPLFYTHLGLIHDYEEYWDRYYKNMFGPPFGLQQQTGSASRNGDGPAPPYDGDNLPTYGGGVPHAGDTKNDRRSSEIGDEDPLMYHGSEAGRSDSGHENPRE